MKREVTKLSRISGIFIGFALVFFIFIFSLTSVLANGDFWLKQNDRYNHQQTLNLASSDDYSVLYHNYIALLQGKKNDFTVTQKGDPEDFTATYKMLGAYHSGEAPSQCETKISLNEKYLETVKAINKAKYSNTDLNNKFFVEFYCQSANESFKGVTLHDLKITDNSGKEFKLLIKEASSLKDGSIDLDAVEYAEEISFTPNSIGDRLRVYLSEGDLENINISFGLSANKGSAGVNIRFSYEDVLTAEDVANRVGPEVNILTDGEKEQFLNVSGINNSLKVISWVLLAVAVILFIYNLKKNGRESLYGMGIYTVIITVFIAVAVTVLVNVVPNEWGFDFVFDFEEGSTSALVVSTSFMNDFAKGAIRFFDFLMLAPLAIGYIFIKKSKKKNYDPNEDYMYQ